MFLRDNDFGFVNTDAIIRWKVVEAEPGVFVIRGYFNTTEYATLNGTWPTLLDAGRLLRDMVGGIDPVGRAWGSQVDGSSTLRSLTGVDET